MTKKNKIFIASIMALTAIGLALATPRYLPQQPRPYRSYPPSLSVANEDNRGELEKISVSPNSRWMIRKYRGGSDAGGSARHYILITDEKGEKPEREIDFMASRFTDSKLRWKTNDTVYVYGQETNVRVGVVRLDKSVSPSGRWGVEVSDIYTDSPGKQRIVHTWAIFSDLREKGLIGKTLVRLDLAPHNEIRWKSTNTIDLYGEVINVRKILHGIPSK